MSFLLPLREITQSAVVDVCNNLRSACDSLVGQLQRCGTSGDADGTGAPIVDTRAPSNSTPAHSRDAGTGSSSDEASGPTTPGAGVSSATLLHARTCLLAFEVLATCMAVRGEAAVAAAAAAYAAELTQARADAGVAGAVDVPVCMTSTNCVPVVLGVRELLNAGAADDVRTAGARLSRRPRSKSSTSTADVDTAMAGERARNRQRRELRHRRRHSQMYGGGDADRACASSPRRALARPSSSRSLRRPHGGDVWRIAAATPRVSSARASTARTRRSAAGDPWRTGGTPRASTARASSTRARRSGEARGGGLREATRAPHTVKAGVGPAASSTASQPQPSTSALLGPAPAPRVSTSWGGRDAGPGAGFLEGGMPSGVGAADTGDHSGSAALDLGVTPVARQVPPVAAPAAAPVAAALVNSNPRSHVRQASPPASPEPVPRAVPPPPPEPSPLGSVYDTDTAAAAAASSRRLALSS